MTTELKPNLSNSLNRIEPSSFTKVMCVVGLNFFCAFQRLKSQSTKYRTDKTYPTKTAEKQDNIKKNRYKDIVPCKFSRLCEDLALLFTLAKDDKLFCIR